MMDKETLGGKIAANRDAAKLINLMLGYQPVGFQYPYNPYVSEKSVKEFKREMERIVSRLSKRERKLFEKLLEMPVEELPCKGRLCTSMTDCPNGCFD